MSEREPSKWPAWLSAWIAALALAVSVVALTWNAYSTDELVRWDTDKFEITSALAIDQLCLNWATYVERLDRQGLKDAQIDARGQWFSNGSDAESSITDYCGTAAGILHQRGRPPAGPDGP